jgi:hypothetical protein
MATEFVQGVRLRRGADQITAAESKKLEIELIHERVLAERQPGNH